MNKKKVIINFFLIPILFTLSVFFLIKNTFLNEEHVAYNDIKKNNQNSKNHEDHDDHEEKKEIKLTEEQINHFDIKTIKIANNDFQQKMTFSGQISLNENKITHVVPAVPGVVKDIFKGLGEDIKSGEHLATIQSLNMAESKSSYITAYTNLSLKKKLFDREMKLWKEKIKSESELIQSENAYENAKIDLNQSKQKLLALDISEEEILKLPNQKIPLNIYTINAPIDGKIIERHITLGEVISNDKQIFVIANLDTVWINLMIPAEDLPKVKKDQKVNVFAHRGENTQLGTIMYVSPVINDETRTGRAIIQLDNSNKEWHPGDFVKAQVIISEQSGFLNLNNSAIQKINGEPFVFIEKEKNTFEAKKIQIKDSDKNEFVEILSGINEGDEVVIKNSFLLKAELGKNEAEHSH